MQELLLGMLAPTLRRNRGHGALQNFQERLLDPFTRYVTRDRGVLRFTRNLVDLVNVNNPLLRFLEIEIGSLDEFEENIFNVFTYVSGLGEGSGIRHGKRYVQLTSQGLRQIGLTGTGGAHQQNVGLGHFDVFFVAVGTGNGEGLPGDARADALVVVVHGHGQSTLGGVLADHVLLQVIVDLLRARELDVVGFLDLGEFLFDDFVAQFNALIANVDARPGNELANLLLAFTAEGAFEQVNALSDARHSQSSQFISMLPSAPF